MATSATWSTPEAVQVSLSTEVCGPFCHLSNGKGIHKAAASMEAVLPQEHHRAALISRPAIVQIVYFPTLPPSVVERRPCLALALAL